MGGYDCPDIFLFASASFILQRAKEYDEISLIAAEILVLFHVLPNGPIKLLEETSRLCEKAVRHGLVYFEAILLKHRDYHFLREGIEIAELRKADNERAVED